MILPLPQTVQTLCMSTRARWAFSPAACWLSALISTLAEEHERITSHPPLGGLLPWLLKDVKPQHDTSTWTAPKTTEVRSLLLKISLMARVMMSSSLFIVDAFFGGRLCMWQPPVDSGRIIASVYIHIRWRKKRKQVACYIIFFFFFKTLLTIHPIICKSLWNLCAWVYWPIIQP